MQTRSKIRRRIRSADVCVWYNKKENEEDTEAKVC